MRLIVDYRKLNLRNISSPEYRHIFLLLFWPLFLLLFTALEENVASEYHVIYSPVDDLIPFCEWFLIPYLFWFVFMVGMLVYTFFFDVEMFRRYMWFVILTYSVTLFIYMVYPNCQNLRPKEFDRDNALIRFIQNYYVFDTNTDVFPSLHVLGALAAMFTGLQCKRLKGAGWKLFMVLSGVSISISTVLIKQHSILDVVSALGVSMVCYYPAYISKFPVASMLLGKKAVKKKRYAA